MIFRLVLICNTIWCKGKNQKSFYGDNSEEDSHNVLLIFLLSLLPSTGPNWMNLGEAPGLWGE